MADVIFPVLVLVPCGVVLIFGISGIIPIFQAQSVKPTLRETVVAFLAGLLAAVAAGAIGGIAAMIACFTLLKGEMSQWALVLGPATATFCAALALVFTVRWFLVEDDSLSETAQ
ncbi:MAG TPA: hypothetical protein VHZ25_17100 [Acidobacteriaceae bacterium]|jgi:hypothetical protein|nr:hypothetical protein [Acidobacteriaceae bacterium]